MLMQKGAFSVHGRAAVIATVAAMALTAVEPSLALAGAAPSGKGLSAATPTSDRLWRPGLLRRRSVLLRRWSLLLRRRIWLWGRRALLPGPSLSRLVTASWCNPLIRRSLWLADLCLLALAVNTLATALD